MASTYTLANAIDYVRSDLAAKGVKVYSDDDITRALKASNRQVAQDLRHYKTSAAESAVASQLEYAWPNLCVEIEAIKYNSAYLVQRSRQWLESRDPSWRAEAAVAAPSVFYLNPTTKFGIWPPPSGVLAISVEGIFVPTFPATSSATFTIPEAYEDLLIYLANALVCLKDIQGFGSDQHNFFKAQYNELLQRSRGNADGSEDTIVGDAKGGSGSLRPAHVGLPVT